MAAAVIMAGIIAIIVINAIEYMKKIMKDGVSEEDSWMRKGLFKLIYNEEPPQSKHYNKMFREAEEEDKEREIATQEWEEKKK